MKKFKKAITAIIVTAMLASAFSAIPFTANAVEVNVPKVSQSRDATNYVVTSGDYRYENIDLRRALDAMEERDKAVIELRYFEDMKLEDIARVLGENQNTVKSRLYRGLKKLRLELTDTWQWE